MPKFRSMKLDTPELATEKLIKPENYYIPLGEFIRKSSLDEIPQFYSIFIGTMSFVGPRPALFNQYSLIKKRANNKIDKLVPGLTGIAQISGRDNLTENQKVDLEASYHMNQSLILDVKILFKTFTKIIKKENVKH